MTANGSALPPPASSDTPRRRVIVLRHGERIDFCLNQDGLHWVNRAFDAAGKYTRFNINMPKTLPKRKEGFQAFREDTPLTEMGYLQAKITGRTGDRGSGENGRFFRTQHCS